MQKTPPYFDPVALRQKLAKFHHDAGNPADARPVVLERLKELVLVARDSARRNLESSGDGRACVAEVFAQPAHEYTRALLAAAAGRGRF